MHLLQQCQHFNSWDFDKQQLSNTNTCAAHTNTAQIDICTHKYTTKTDAYSNTSQKHLHTQTHYKWRQASKAGGPI